MANGHWPGGLFLDHDDYFKDFEREYATLDDSYLKLERSQHFIEPGNPSWNRFAAGDWSGALTAIQSELAHDSRDNFEAMRARNLRALRLRVVKLPVTPYVQWEMHVLRMQAEYGEDVRILTEQEYLEKGNDDARGYPELIILDRTLMYEILYDPKGENTGANKYTDAALVAATRESVEQLFSQGQPAITFFEDAIASLRPPGV